jgi:hypothetical protein
MEVGIYSTSTTYQAHFSALQILSHLIPTVMLCWVWFLSPLQI